MGSMVVVAVQPIGRHFTHFLQRLEDVAVQHLGAVGLVEFLDIGVLSGFTRLNVLERNTLGLRPTSRNISYVISPRASSPSAVRPIFRR